MDDEIDADYGKIEGMTLILHNNERNHLLLSWGACKGSPIQ